MSYKQRSPIIIAEGGSGATSFTAYAPIIGGTTSTGALQSVASVGTAGQVLTSNGAGAAATFQAAGGGGAWTLIQTQDASSSASLVFSTGVTSTYTNYVVTIGGYVPGTDATDLRLHLSTDGGGTYYASGLYNSFIVNAFNDATNYIGSSSNAAFWLLGSAIPSAGDTAYSSTIWLYDLSSASVKQTMIYNTIYSAPRRQDSFGYSSNAVAAVNAIKFTSSSGNLGSGQFSLYGISK